MFDKINIYDISSSFNETFLMTLVTSIFVLILGLCLGYALYKSEKKNNLIYKVLNIVSSVGRSIPFIILIILLLPFTDSLFKILFGEDSRLLFNWPGAVPALVISATPFYARLVHSSLKEVSSGTKEMLLSLGASQKRTFIVIVSEALPSLVAGFTTTVVTLIGFSSAAAIIGAGGLGDLAYRERNNTGIVIIATFLILVLVFLVQAVGDLLVKKIDKK